MTRKAPDGCRWEWMPDKDWKVGGDGRMCRRQCGNLAVAALRRRRSNARGGFQWWHYCADHLYGREIRDGVVMVERLVQIEGAKP